MILAPLQKFTNNVLNLVKIIVATGFELLPKVQKIAQSGHTVHHKHHILSQRAKYLVINRYETGF